MKEEIEYIQKKNRRFLILFFSENTNQKSSVSRFITLLSVTFPHSHSYYLSAVTPVFNDGTDGYR